MSDLVKKDSSYVAKPTRGDQWGLAVAGLVAGWGLALASVTGGLEYFRSPAPYHPTLDKPGIVCTEPRNIVEGAIDSYEQHGDYLEAGRLAEIDGNPTEAMNLYEKGSLRHGRRGLDNARALTRYSTEADISIMPEERSIVWKLQNGNTIGFYYDEADDMQYFVHCTPRVCHLMYPTEGQHPTNSDFE